MLYRGLISSSPSLIILKVIICCWLCEAGSSVGKFEYGLNPQQFQMESHKNKTPGLAVDT